MTDESGSTVALRGGGTLSCLVCGNDTFHERRWQLNTAGATFFDVDFLNQSATCYVCSRCRHIHWFNL
ncbi:hypothetical protein [Nocardiopsis halophila]|uniref:hypothetical protein n=1 Tax=Nocardiopsis halophila TaxID=141692 RepID=UPI0003474642|nr:hypothetical protein [Nocardiopsis halophila]